MKCPRCGTDNKAGAQNCYLCGQKLIKGKIKQSPSQKIWAKDTKNAIGPEDKPYRHRNRYANKPPTREPFVAINDEDQQLYMDGEGGLSPSNQQKLKKLKNGQVVRVAVPMPAASKRKKKMGGWRFFISLVAIVAVLGGVVFGFYKGVQFVSSLIGRQREEAALRAQPQEPLVEQVMVDGASWHKITFYGDDSERIMITEPRRTLAIHNGTAELMLEDASYIPSDPDVTQEKVDVTLQATLFTASGEEKPIAVPTFSVEIPLSELTVIAPQEQAITTNETRVTVTIKVVPGSRVLIGPHNVTDRVNNDGIVTQSVETESSGTIDIIVETKNHRRNEYQLQVTRAEMAVPITVDASTVSSTEDGAVFISGKTEAGATISTDAALQDNDLNTSADGEFYFTAKLTQYGTNVINITATASDGRTATLAYRVERQPNLDSYTRAAWAMDYNHLVASVDTQIGQVYLCKGKVTKKLDTPLGNQYLFDCGDTTPQLIVIEYDGSLGLAVDKSYRLYADVKGTQDGYPLLVARYAYNN